MKNILVSVLVITYNSAKYIEEALNSVEAQTYQSIELIISDDCSNDNTTVLCQKWLKQHSNRFVKTKLITTDKNSGVSRNANRALGVANGEWIKLLAGDDVLLNNCIENYINFAEATQGSFLFGLPSILISPANDLYKEQMESYYYNSLPFFKLCAEDQFKYLLINRIPISPPTLFCRKATLIELGGFDERYACEDLPLYLQATYRGFRLNSMKTQTVYYRIHSDQLSYTPSDKILNERWFYEQWKIRRVYFTSKFIVLNPTLSMEFIIQMLPRFLRLKTGNNTRNSSRLFSYLATVKNKFSFLYIRKF